MAPFSPKTNCAHPAPPPLPLTPTPPPFASRLITALKRSARVHDAHPCQSIWISALDRTGTRYGREERLEILLEFRIEILNAGKRLVKTL